MAKGMIKLTRKARKDFFNDLFGPNYKFEDEECFYVDTEYTVYARIIEWFDRQGLHFNFKHDQKNMRGRIYNSKLKLKYRWTTAESRLDAMKTFVVDAMFIYNIK